MFLEYPQNRNMWNYFFESYYYQGCKRIQLQRLIKIVALFLKKWLTMHLNERKINLNNSILKKQMSAQER